MSQMLLSVNDLHVHFPVFGGIFYRKLAEIKAVDGVSFEIRKGETLGLVGESGCGKSTVGRAIINVLRFIAPDVHLKGEIILHLEDQQKINLLNLDKKSMRPYRRKVQMVFQDPYSSLNPRLTIKQIIEEPLEIHNPDMSESERDDRVAWLLSKVGLRPEQARRYPHEFSGGQRQRIGVARSLATNPDLIIADEPVSALDVSIQAQVLNLLLELQEEFHLTYLFIAHDLSVVHHISNRIAVMYLGNIVEIGPSEIVFYDPKHPYTKALISAVPRPEPQRTRPKRQVLVGDVPTPLAKPSGCGFRTRCPIAKPECAKSVPQFVDKGDDHFVACPYV
ncbi:MAG: ATP-binding cassette domain-containing protein [bacterium]|nr:ATP-binding cassette domain-containing protein [bacterium]